MTVIVIYIALLALLLFGIKYNVDGSDMLSKDNTDALRGVFCIVVVLSHLTDCSPYLYLAQLVFICVFCFFMFSGYGLTVSLAKYDGRGGANRRIWFGRQIKRVMKLLIPLGIVCFIEINANLNLFSGGGFWFIVISALYLIYGLLAVMIRDRKYVFSAMVLISLLYSIFYQFVLHDGIMWPPQMWPPQELGFAIGILVGVYKEKIELFVKKYSGSVTIISMIVFLAVAIGYIYKYSGEHDYTVLSTGMYVGRVIMQITALLIILIFLSKFKIGNRVSLYIGKHLSMYVFLIHGVIIDLAILAGIDGERRIILVLISTITIAILFDSGVQFAKRRIIDS